MQPYRNDFRFQFLMVRLKVCDGKLFTSSLISVSIPYGTIKSTLVSAGANETIEFQFLMVRLKENLFKLLSVSLSRFNSLWYD